MSHEPPLEAPDGILDRQIVCPKMMGWMVDIEREEADRFRHGQEVRRESGIGNDSDERTFGERAGRPSLSTMSRKPSLHSLMGAMSWPRQGNQSTYVEQKSSHSNSFSNSLTRSVVTSGESGGSTTTWMPLTTFVAIGAFNPRRTSSDTAFPKAKERLSA